MKIKNKFGSKNFTAKKNREIKYIVVHYTAGVTSKSGSALNTAVWFASGKASTSSDFIVDDTDIVQYNEDIKNKYTWHCGGVFYPQSKGGKYYRKCTNANSIGIEVCSVNSTGEMQNANDKSYSFTDSAINNTVLLVKYLMEKYAIPAENVIRHYDVTGKPCPGIIGWNLDSGSESAWNVFKKSIGGKSDDVSPKYFVQVGAFSDKTLAENYLVKVKKTYREAFIKTMAGSPLYYVQVGAFSDKSNVEEFLKSVKKDYPEAFIKTF